MDLPGLEKILSFWTGLKAIPPLGFVEPLKVNFLPSSQIFALPRAAACFCKLVLPTCYDDKETFFQKMDIGIGNSVGHFGLV